MASVDTQLKQKLNDMIVGISAAIAIQKWMKDEHDINDPVADKVYLTGKKETKKIYYKHTGHPGGLKETTPEKMKLNNKSTDIIKKAIKRMIPKGPLGYQQLSNCKIYSGSIHLHEAQNPLTLDISKLNDKNINR